MCVCVCVCVLIFKEKIPTVCTWSRLFIYLCSLCALAGVSVRARWKRLDLFVLVLPRQTGISSTALTKGWTPPGWRGGHVTSRLLLQSRPSRVNPATLTFCLMHDDMLYISTDPTYTRHHHMHHTQTPICISMFGAMLRCTCKWLESMLLWFWRQW